MKFLNGYWLSQSAYDLNYATQVYDIEITKHAIKILATSEVIVNRGQTLKGPNLEITYSSYAKDVIKVHIDHFTGGIDNDPKFDLTEDYGYTPTIVENDTYVELISGHTRVVVHKGESWRIEYFYKNKLLTSTNWRSTIYAVESKSHVKTRLETHNDDYYFDYPADPRHTYLSESLNLSVGECIYGFGEKFTNFVKNGQVVETWNADGGTCSQYSYKSIPFYISSNSYGVFVNSSDKVSFEVGSETVSKVSFTLPGESLEYFIIGGQNLKEVLMNYTLLTGKPALPPAYSFGLWLSTSFTTNYDEETVNSFIDGMSQRDIPLQVFHFDCFWMKEFEWCNMEWDRSQFPQPEKMIQRLKDKGLDICVWINPYVGQKSKLFNIGKENDYFIKNNEGSVFQTDFWQPGMAIVDFTNPEAINWYKGLLKNLFSMGINNIKTDFGERIPYECVYYNKAHPIKMHNYYTYLYNKVVSEALDEFYGKGKSCLFSRSATVGGQKFPVHWGGDCFAQYSAMSETLRAGLSLCSSGFGFFSHDIGGFEATASPDVYKRWCAFGLMSTHSRLHGSNTYRVPWLFDEESNDVLRFYTKLKGRLMPYLYAQAIKTNQTGIPMMRAMVVEFSEDPACKYIDSQYMLGDSLMIVPVMNEQGTASFYVPEGIWQDIVTHDIYKGGRYYQRVCNYMQMPILAREDAVISFGHFKENVIYDYVDQGEFIIYHLNSSATTSVYNTEGELEFELAIIRKENQIIIQSSPTQKEWIVKILNLNLSISSTEMKENQAILSI